MRLPRFEYLEPETVEEACSLLFRYKEQARVLAGGTDLLVMMKQRVMTPAYLVNIKTIRDLDYIREDNGGIRIGALTTLSSLESSPVIRQKLPVLSAAAGKVATRQIQSTATLGGNLCLDSKCWFYNQSDTWRKSREACIKRGGNVCHVVKGGRRCYAVVSGDTVAALIALGARVKIAGSEGTRTLPLDEFFTGKGESPITLKPGEMLTEIEVPPTPLHSRGAFEKYSIRGAIDFGVADAAALLTLEDKMCTDATLVISSVGPAVVRVREAEEILKGKEINPEVVEEVGNAAVKGTRLVSGAQHSVYFRRKIINALSKQVVRQAAGMA